MCTLFYSVFLKYFFSVKWHILTDFQKRVKYKPLAIAKIFYKFNQTKFASNNSKKKSACRDAFHKPRRILWRDVSSFFYLSRMTFRYCKYKLNIEQPSQNITMLFWYQPEGWNWSTSEERWLTANFTNLYDKLSSLM